MAVICSSIGVSVIAVDPASAMAWGHRDTTALGILMATIGQATHAGIPSQALLLTVRKPAIPRAHPRMRAASPSRCRQRIVSVQRGPTTRHPSGRERPSLDLPCELSDPGHLVAAQVHLFTVDQLRPPPPPGPQDPDLPPAPPARSAPAPPALTRPLLRPQDSSQGGQETAIPP